MPYIKQDRRDRIKDGIQRQGTHDPRDACPQNAGELNYLVTEIVTHYIATHGSHFAIYAEVLGALESAKLELYRRVIAPHEDKAMALNGDVYYNEGVGALQQSGKHTVGL